MKRDLVAGARAPVAGASGERELDLRGVVMPKAYLRVRRTLQALAPGQQLLVACSDPEGLRGFPALARLCGHDIVEQHEVDADYFFVFRRR